MIESERIQRLNNRPDQPGDYVLYWMQASQRATWNPALEFAIEQANERSVPVLGVFGLLENGTEPTERHYAFLLEGLRETWKRLSARGIPLITLKTTPDMAALAFASKAVLLVTDRGYLRHQKLWREKVAREASCPVIQIESDVIAPIELVSNKEEYTAATIRPKIWRYAENFLNELPETPVEHYSSPVSCDTFAALELSDIDGILATLPIDRSIRRVNSHIGGSQHALQLLQHFTERTLEEYAEFHSNPNHDVASHLSPYLHFGQISPVQIMMTVRNSPWKDSLGAFIEQLLVRRELSHNFVYYSPSYDSFDCLPNWARATLEAHRGDIRETIYSYEALEKAQTLDPAWNAAQQEMVYAGQMHNYMRMYWGKKILEWSADPRIAYDTALKLNNRYQLDGNDPSSYAGVAWCFGKHDRPWAERSIFGMVRYMNYAGLTRKFNIDHYIRHVERLASSEV